MNWEAAEFDITFRECDAVHRHTACDDNLPNAEFARHFDHVVRAEGITPESLVFRDEHVASVAGEVDDDIWALQERFTEGLGEAEVGAKSVEYLAAGG